MELKKISYKNLKARQQENYNFHKIAAILADYGFNSLRLNDDWQGADFLAYHVNGTHTLKVQLKGGCTIEKKYVGKDIMMAFPHNGDWYLIHHDELVEKIGQQQNSLTTKAWLVDGSFFYGKLSAKMLKMLEPYKL